MNLTIHNLLMRFNSPSVQAILLGLAITFMAIPAKALDLLVIDNPNCGHCQRFDQEVGQAGYDAHSVSEKATLSYITMRRDKAPPAWFMEAYNEGRIKNIRGTPTFILLDIPPGETESREVGRVVGYGGRDWFFDRITTIVDGYLEWKAAQ